MSASKVPSGVMQRSRPLLGRAADDPGRASRGSDGRTGAATDPIVFRERIAARARSTATRIEGKAHEELKLVMREIADALSARAAALTMHPADARPPTVLHADEAGVAGLDRIEELLRSGQIDIDADDAAHRWLSQPDDAGLQDVLLISVDRVDGHSPLLISAFFDRLSPERRQAAEEVYLRRRPFAVGYFRLWQLERTRRHRIAALQAAINLTEVGVMLIDRRGGLVFCNDAGTQILDAGDGLARRSHSLHATNLREDIRLQVALGHVIGTSLADADADDQPERRAPIMSISRLRAPPLILSVLPTGQPAIEPSDVAAILYVLDPALDTDPLLEPVCKLFQLTPVETKLVCQLAGGATLAHAAESMRVKELTARSCLKQVFLKTGTNRQADLVRVMLSNLARTTRTIPTEVI